MDEDFKKARFSEIKMQKHKRILKNAIMHAGNNNRVRVPLIRWIANTAALLLVLAAGITASIYLVIENNRNEGMFNSLGGMWCTYDDSKSGGNSVVWPPSSTADENNFVKSAPGYGNRGYAVRITGRAGTAVGADFLGVMTFLSSRASCPECTGVDISMYRGIKFKIKGSISKGSMYIMLPYESAEMDRKYNSCMSLTNYADYEANITKNITKRWKTVKVRFKDMKQPEWVKKKDIVDIEKVLADARLIKWQYKGGGGEPVDIWIDELEFF